MEADANEPDANEDRQSSCNDAEITAELTAYLDGELDSDSVHRVEERLSTDTQYRSLMQQLQRTWDALDILPAASVKQSFTQSTVELAVEDAKRTRTGNHRSTWTSPLRVLVFALIASAASTIGFAVNRYIQRLPNEKLFDNLTVIQNLDVLQCDDSLSIELLEALANRQSTFAMVATDADRERQFLHDQPLPDLKSLARLNQYGKQQFSKNYEQFQALPPERQQAAKELNQAIETHPNRDQLKTSLYRYAFWLKQQTSLDAAKVLDSKSINAKLQQIREIADAQFLPNFAAQLPEKDKAKIFLAFALIVNQKWELIDQRFFELFGLAELLNLPEVNDKANDTNYRLTLTGYKLSRIFETHPEVIEEIVDPELVRVVKTTILSNEAINCLELALVMADALEMADTFGSSRQNSEILLLTRWMLKAFEDSPLNRPPDLQKFYQSLSASERQRIDNEFPDDRRKELMRLHKERYPLK